MTKSRSNIAKTSNMVGLLESAYTALTAILVNAAKTANSVNTANIVNVSESEKCVYKI